MPDVVIAQPAIKSTPAAYLVAGAQAFELLSVQASYDGSAAAGAFLPALQLVDPGGHVMATATATSVAAGASAAVSWFPGVGAETASPNPVVANQLDYVEITSSVTVHPANTSANQKTLIASNSLVFDGATRVRIEVFSPTFDTEGGNNLILDLWDNSTDLGRLGMLDLDPNPTDLGVPLYLARYLTPTAGAHVFTFKGWTSGAGGSSSFGAGPGGVPLVGDPFYMPAWMRIST